MASGRVKKPLKPMTLERALKAARKSDTLRSARLCPCEPCTNRVRRVIWELMGHHGLPCKTGAEQPDASGSLASDVDTTGIDPALVAAVELGLEDLMPTVTTIRNSSTGIYMFGEVEGVIISKNNFAGMAGSGYPKGGK